MLPISSRLVFDFGQNAIYSLSIFGLHSLRSPLNLVRRNNIMDDICVVVGLNIRKKREDKGLSQEELADLSDLHRTYIGQVERGEKNLTIRSLERIAKALKVATRELF